MIVYRRSTLCFFSFTFLGTLAEPNLVTLHELHASTGFCTLDTYKTFNMPPLNILCKYKAVQMHLHTHTTFAWQFKY